jgi:protocatechuate 3,4-dioxygenase beta subunit
MPPANEPGPPLLVEGTLYKPDGTTPAPGVIVYAYQTGVDGLYAPRGVSIPRIKAWVKTDQNGRFTLETIRPGSYPNTTNPAHIHFQMWGGGYPAQYGPELLFEDDRLVAAQERERSRAQGRFAYVLQPRDGRVEMRLRLKTAGDRFEDNTMHGHAPCQT